MIDEKLKQFKRDFNNNRFHLHGYANVDLLVNTIRKLMEEAQAEKHDRVDESVAYCFGCDKYYRLVEMKKIKKSDRMTL